MQFKNVLAAAALAAVVRATGEDEGDYCPESCMATCEAPKTVTSTSVSVSVSTVTVPHTVYMTATPTATWSKDTETATWYSASGSKPYETAMSYSGKPKTATWYSASGKPEGSAPVSYPMSTATISITKTVPCPHTGTYCPGYPTVTVVPMTTVYPMTTGTWSKPEGSMSMSHASVETPASIPVKSYNSWIHTPQSSAVATETGATGSTWSASAETPASYTVKSKMMSSSAAATGVATGAYESSASPMPYASGSPSGTATGAYGASSTAAVVPKYKPTPVAYSPSPAGTPAQYTGAAANNFVNVGMVGAVAAGVAMFL